MSATPAYAESIEKVWIWKWHVPMNFFIQYKYLILFGTEWETIQKCLSKKNLSPGWQGEQNKKWSDYRIGKKVRL